MAFFYKRFNRFNSKIIFFVAFAIAIFLLITTNILPTTNNDNKNFFGKTNSPSNCQQQNEQIRKFRCLIEGSRKLPCLIDDGNNEIYMPFEFIKKQFDVTGKLNKENFEYYTSSSKIRVPDEDYNSTGIFGHFASYNVEIRDRVKCINPEYGVPMSIQWNLTPYFYPIQIAQFSLQHYSRFIIDSNLKKTNIYNFEKIDSNFVKQITNKNFTLLKLEAKSNVLSASFDLKNTNELNLSVLLFSWKPNSAKDFFSLKIEELINKKIIILNYKFVVDDSRCLWSEMDIDSYDANEAPDELIFTYSLGDFPPPQQQQETVKFKEIILDLIVESTKALSLLKLLPKNKENGLKNGDIQLLSLDFYGSPEILLPIKQQNKAHYEMFIRSVDWFIRNQDSVGGWSVPVERQIIKDRLVLKEGWHSAMAQGHALSVLTRAYFLTKNTIYISSAKNALKLFKMQASENGVVNKLLGYTWYEEYPTTPGTFVLNGFIYSLIGLFDVSNIPELKVEARELFDDGLKSLLKFLPLYDTGDGSIYDLRHLDLKLAPNLARWDYHAVHVYLLKLLHNITREKFLNEVAERWLGYSKGKKTKHN